MNKVFLVGDGPYRLGTVNLTIYQLLNQPITITANNTTEKPTWYQVLYPEEKRRIRFVRNKTFRRYTNKESVKVKRMSVELDHTGIVYSSQNFNSATAVFRAGGTG